MCRGIPQIVEMLAPHSTRQGRVNESVSRSTWLLNELGPGDWVLIQWVRDVEDRQEEAHSRWRRCR